MKLNHLLIMILLGVFISSCNSHSPKKGKNDQTDSITREAAATDTIKIRNGQLPIFYNMYLSVEMSSLFKSIGATFNYKLLNSPDKVEKYNSSTDKAMNLGVYAVDLSYCKYFEQFDPAGRYLKNMHELATDMGIPDDKFYLSVKRIETNLTNKDSLIKIANELYVTTDKYLKDNDRGSSAALIILGGWTEAMYIATNLNKNEPRDLELIDQIAEQRYSLDNLIDLLDKYQSDKIVKAYLEKLMDLKICFSKLKVDVRDMDKTYSQLKPISAKLLSIRKEIVS